MRCKTLNTTLLISSVLIGLTACAPEVGSDAWCRNMADKPKGDWSTNQATEFARNCVLKTYE